jgi:hypothetical protein
VQVRGWLALLAGLFMRRVQDYVESSDRGLSHPGTGASEHELHVRPAEGGKRRGFPDQFHLLFERGRVALLDAAREGQMRTVDFRIALSLMDRLGSVQFTPLNQASFAAELAVSQAEISRSLSRLVGVRFLERENRGGGRTSARWRINPEFVFRGSVLSYQIARRERVRSAAQAIPFTRPRKPRNGDGGDGPPK